MTGKSGRILTESDLKEIRAHSKSLLISAICELIDTGYLAVWAVPQFLFDRFIFRPLELIGWNLVILTICQIVLGISTVVPIATNFYSDTRIIIVRARKRFEKAKAEMETEP